MSVTSTCAIEEAFFLVKSKTPGLGIALHKCWIIRISELSDVGLKKFCCTKHIISKSRTYVCK